ncbi:MAG: Trk system potassium transporter TrkA [Lachnospiraceae bacterium]|nr:Trk system potassium transporter TrkA [Lachnospiraceae bacterium]
MKVLIVGCGKVGSNLAGQLCHEGHEVTILDLVDDHMKDVSNAYDVMGIIGDGTSIEALKDAGIAQADLLCAVMDSDEANLLCCLIARQLSKARLIARVRKPVYSKETQFFRDHFDLAMVINPELASAAEMARIFRLPSAISIDVFAKGRVEMMSFRVKADSPLCGLSLVELRSKYRQDVLICVAERGDEVVIPSGDFVIQEGDILSIVANQQGVSSFFEAIGVAVNPVKNVMIVGGGTMTYYLAKALLSSGIKVKIIEMKRPRAEWLAEELPAAEIICGDGTDEELLQEEGISQVQGLAALTGIDEENIMLSLYAQSETSVNAKIVTKINRITFNKVIDSMNLDSIINPKELTAEYILKYIRSMDATSSAVENLYRLADGRVEALEFHIYEEEKSVTGIKLQDLKIQDNVLIAKIFRKGQLITPSGQSELQVGDSVVVVAMADRKLSRIGDILKR